MEVARPGQAKRLHRHAAPVAMVAVVLLALSAIILSGYNGAGQNSESVLSRGLVTRVLHIRPETDGLARVTLGNASPPAANADSSLQTGLAQAGGTIQLSLNLQKPPAAR